MAWAPDYVTAADLRAYLRIGDGADDVFLGLWATAVSRNVDAFCNRQFGKVAGAESRTYTTVYDRHLACWVAEIDDLCDAGALVVVDRNGTTITDYELQPVNSLVKARPYERVLTSVPGPLTMTSPSWGWSAVPAAVPSGAYLQAARLAARRDSPFGIAGSPSEQGEVRLLAQLDPDFRTVLQPYVRRWWAA